MTSSGRQLELLPVCLGLCVFHYVSEGYTEGFKKKNIENGRRGKTI